MELLVPHPRFGERSHDEGRGRDERAAGLAEDRQVVTALGQERERRLFESRIAASDLAEQLLRLGALSLFVAAMGIVDYTSRIGTPFSRLIADCGGYTERMSRLIMGGSMMGTPLPHEDLPVIKATNCVVAASALQAICSASMPRL